MTTNKRTINKQEFDIPAITTEAITYVDSGAAKLDPEFVTMVLRNAGHRDPAPELIARFTREYAILKRLARVTGAGFDRQLGKIDFSSTDTAIDGVQAYLWRRVHGQRHNYSARYGR